MTLWCMTQKKHAIRTILRLSLNNAEGMKYGSIISKNFKERLNKFHRSTQDTLVLKGLNDGMKERLHHILNESKQHPVAEVYSDFIAVKHQY